MSIHLFGRPRLLLPGTYPFIAMMGNLSWLIPATCQKTSTAFFEFFEFYTLHTIHMANGEYDLMARNTKYRNGNKAPNVNIQKYSFHTSIQHFKSSRRADEKAVWAITSKQLHQPCWPLAGVRYGAGTEQSIQFNITVSPQDFFAFSHQQVRTCATWQTTPSPHYRELNPNAIQFSSFDSVAEADVMKLIHDAPNNKQCWLDPIPVWMLKEYSDLLFPFLTEL